MAGTDNHQNSGSRRVNIKSWGGALTKTCPDTNFHVYWYYGYCVTCFQEEEEEEEKHGQNGKNIFGYNIHIWCSFTEIFGILFSFHI